MKIKVAICFMLIFAFLAGYILYHWDTPSDAALVIHMIAFPFSTLFEALFGIAHSASLRVAMICVAGFVQYAIIGYLVGAVWDWIEAQVGSEDEA